MPQSDDHNPSDAQQRDEPRYHRLRVLAERYERGELTDVEFAAEKKRILRGNVSANGRLADPEIRELPGDRP